MRKFKFRQLILFAIATLCTVLIVPVLNAEPYIANAAYNYIILESGVFSENVTISGNSYSLNCYRIQNYDTYIAVAWGSEPSNAPETISIPETITSNKPTGENVDYTVVAVARGGFSHCSAKSIVLPQTVKDIREEAFAYCHNLASFQFPKDVEIVAPSTFIDCRSLSSIYYSSEEGKKTLTNSKITTFGNHSFDSCINLRKIQCPSSATFFGQSCFQKCSKLTRFRFPYDNGLTGEQQNAITVEEYAFADCDTLQRVYFDINMLHISDYAFADSRTDLAFYLYGSEIPASLSAKWRNKRITTYSDGEVDYNTVVYDVHFNEIKPAGEAEGYPGLTFTISSEARKLDNARTNNTSVYIIDSTEAATPYAIVSGFETPDEEDWIEGYYNNGELTIPDKVRINNVEYVVKVIDNRAFEEKDDLKEVHFNEHLVQIMNHAFYHSNNIENLDFTECLHLKEISYCIFNEPITPSDYADNGYEAVTDEALTWAADNKNMIIEGIILPNCLEYLGNFAFFNFVNLQTCIKFKTNEAQSSKLKIIGDYAFAVYSGKNFGDAASKNKYYSSSPGSANAKVDIVLPRSLDDAEAPAANIFHSYQADTCPNINEIVINRVAVNKSAFENQDALRSVTMESGGTAHDISFASNTFIRCDNLLRFEASDNLCLIGHEALKCCHNLREVFLTSERAKNNHSHYTNGAPDGGTVSSPWGVKDDSNDYRDNNKPILAESTFENLVVYIKPPASGTFNNGGKTQYVHYKTYGGSHSIYKDELANAERGRNNHPIYTVDWTQTGNIKYWKLNGTTNSNLLDFEDGPRTLDDYNSGYISFYKNNASNNTYTVARYYTDGQTDNFSKTVDLTSSKLGSIKVNTIGNEAFGGFTAMGYYFVLPSSITIGERAFFRSGALDRCVRVVTFKNGSNIQVNATNVGVKTFEQIVATIEGQADGSKSGYCCLPASVKSVGSDAFYNNLFGSIELSNAYSKIDRTAFYTHYSGSTLWGQNQSFLFTNYSGTTGHSKFTVINNGIYYTAESDYKMLVLQSNGITGELVVDDGTKAIGNRAAASSKYSSVTFDDDTTIIYGQAFANCLDLTTLNNISQIKYINASVNSPDIEINTKGDYDQAKTTGTGAFNNCKNLKLDVSQMTSIVKIGDSAFNGCTNIATGLTLNKTYSFFKYTSSTGEEARTDPANRIVDLSTLSSLTTLGNAVFDNCGIDYVITPNTTGEDYNVESNFYCGNANVFPKTAIKLCGETAHQADQSSQFSSLKPTTHYKNGGLNGDYKTLYYRIHSYDDVITTQTTQRHYWTAVKTGNANQIKIVTFETKDDVQAWLAVGNNAANQCHTFPEQ